MEVDLDKMKFILILDYLDPSCLPCWIKNPDKKQKTVFFVDAFLLLGIILRFHFDGTIPLQKQMNFEQVRRHMSSK